jgi:hypothetical protein
MHLRHISPRSIDWMDAMDEGAGGRGWERLAPEEREKLLRERRPDDDAKSGRVAAESAHGRVATMAQGIALPSASK